MPRKLLPSRFAGGITATVFFSD